MYGFLELSYIYQINPILKTDKNWIDEATRTKLFNFKLKNQTSNLKLPPDSVNTIKSVLTARRVNQDIEYLVKFAGCPATDACWEPTKNFPTFIVEYYKNIS